jgi:acyl-CoA thioesterase-2
MSISFQVREAGLSHQFDMPDVPPPEDLKSEEELRAEQAHLLSPEEREMFTRERPIEMRQVYPQNMLDPEIRAPQQYAWMRCRDPLPDDERLHQCVLAYLSDWSLLDTCTYPHGVSFRMPGLQMASLDHALWYHRRFRADDWLLYAQDSPSASGARGFNRGLIYSRDGALVASAVQEGLLRVHDDAG